MLIDCHVHLSKYNHKGKSFSQIRDALLLTMEQSGVSLSLVCPDSEPNTEVADLDTTLNLVAGCRKLLMYGTACIDTLTATSIEKLDGLAKDNKIIGVKLYPGFERFYPDDKRCHSLYELCLKHNLPVLFHSGETMNETWREKYNHPREFEKVSKRFPDLKIIIAHFSQPHLKSCLKIITKYRNVYADISGLTHPEVITLCGKKEIFNILKTASEHNPDKILFGTDWPICDVESHKQLISSLPVSDPKKALIFGMNAVKVFSLQDIN